ncbi:MAG TPA: carboxypeptidase regulatory-like domain-containing protein, partial [Kofleriaceae bacterium]|nr:carboxypeptidase regulatory-like domain-containing protein [Kofleriaceae bacterium]
MSSSAYAQKPKTREVTGVVLDVDAKPIANATVSIANGPTATTGADGAFKLAAPVSEAIIEISADGFTAKQVPILAATTALQMQLTLVKPAPPATTSRVITGIVTGGDHAPIANARVHVQGTSIETLTAADGTFVLPNVSAGEAILDIEAPNQPATTAPVAADRAVIAVTVGASAATAAPAQTSRKVSGRVIDPATKEGIAGAQVEVKSTGQIAFTEADGSFVLESLPMTPVQL